MFAKETLCNQFTKCLSIITRKRFLRNHMDDRLLLPFSEWVRPDTQIVEAQSLCTLNEKEGAIMLGYRRRRQVDCIGPVNSWRSGTSYYRTLCTVSHILIHCLAASERFKRGNGAFHTVPFFCLRFALLFAGISFDSAFSGRSVYLARIGTLNIPVNEKLTLNWWWFHLHPAHYARRVMREKGWDNRVEIFVR